MDIADHEKEIRRTVILRVPGVKIISSCSRSGGCVPHNTLTAKFWTPSLKLRKLTLKDDMSETVIQKTKTRVHKKALRKYSQDDDHVKERQVTEKEEVFYDAVDWCLEGEEEEYFDAMGIGDPYWIAETCCGISTTCRIIHPRLVFPTGKIGI
ncbi:uncharacterized protein BYT42DRAFT_634683 [Radiomyces spectabilis]|uniref:uncharacterized protein n=1 Tax=Radiomyces spectabilis TaxID=64574 RepID=UPI0022203E73|nr:uncharacterized protein BYT42DRAFT_634683 [Radiomyces spectabilis]KAI8381441.1 hypothetical protein BYT42DRAFT_634683 [Radiomyces spectabilis]